MDYKKIKKFFKDFYSKPYCWTEDDPRYKGFIKKFVYEYYNTNGLNPIGIKIKRYSLKKEYKEYKEYLKRKIKVSVLFWDIFRFTCVFIYGFTFVWMAMVLNVNQYSEYTIEFDPS